MTDHLPATPPASQVGFVFTNFNNSLLTLQALQSLFSAPAAARCVVVIVDNRSRDEERALLAQARAISDQIHIIENPDNIGYFPGLNVGMAYLRTHFPAIDLMVIGNNDLVFPADFVATLDRKQALFAQYPVVCPDLLTLDGVHQNPHVLKPVSRTREIVWDLYFSNFQLAVLIKKLAGLTRRFTGRKDYQQHREAGPIYMGYGACYILTARFFKEIGTLWAPTFLMGEEFYLAKQLLARNYQFYYEPSISVAHHDHATVSKMPSRQLWEFTRQYHRVYRQFVDPYRLKMDNGRDYRDFQGL
jgi:GT2 family glycosyltransferase